MIFVDVTENGDMSREVKKVVKINNMKVKVVEKMRGTLKRKLQE